MNADQARTLFVLTVWCRMIFSVRRETARLVPLRAEEQTGNRRIRKRVAERRVSGTSPGVTPISTAFPVPGKPAYAGSIQN